MQIEHAHADLVGEVARPFVASARNLLHYVALRRHDLRELQRALAELGLSSLGRSERRVRIMVTMPLEAAGDYGFVRALVAVGIDCMRINCAHGTQDDWLKLLEHLHRARKELGTPCSSLMVLSGPNPRTLVHGGERETRYFKGDHLVLARGEVPDPPPFGDRYPVISCTLPEIIGEISPGDRRLMDDGKIAMQAEETAEVCVLLRVTRSGRNGRRLKNEKGINHPDTDLKVEPLTAADLELLHFIARHADIVGYSFVRRPEDVFRLGCELSRAGGDHLGIVLKIETVAAFRALPRLLLAATRGPRAGVMIARGDMGVEGGFERLAEVQEEMLWFCEAATCPSLGQPRSCKPS